MHKYFYFSSECVPIDFTIALDSSGSVSRSGWQKLLTFSRDLLARMTLSSACAQAAMISYGTQADVYSRLDQHMTRSQLNDVIASMRFKDQAANIGDAFRKMYEVVYTSANGDRSTARNVALLLTDEYGNREPEHTIPNAQVGSTFHHRCVSVLNTLTVIHVRVSSICVHINLKCVCAYFLCL